MRQYRAAFSLAEALITIFLVFAVFGVASGLLSEYSKILRFSAVRENRFSVAQVALKRMVDESREAMVWESPLAGGSPNLTFQRVDPAFASWLPRPFDPYNHTFTSWTPQPAAQMLRVDYAVSGGQLIRSLAPVSGGTTSTSVVAQGVTGLQVTAPGGGAVEIVLSVEDSHQLVTPLKTLVWRPGP